MEITQPREPLSHPQNAWLFDVDGVITNPLEKSITEPGMIPEIVKRLNAFEPVGIVSGRALPWLIAQVVSLVENQATDKALLENLFVSAEFGGVSVHYKDGQEVKVIDQSVSLPEDLKDRVSGIVRGEFEDVAFIDEEKVTHFSAEMKRGVSMEQFKKRQGELSARLVQAVKDADQTDEIEVHNDRIATNVKNRKLNKHLAIQKILKWLDDRGITPQMFHVFGDSRSDLEMGYELNTRGKKVRFVYVGEEDLGELPFEVVQQGNVDKGTLEYLLSN